MAYGLLIIRFGARVRKLAHRCELRALTSIGYARRGGNALRVPLDDVLLRAQARGIEVLALDDALASLSTLDARKGRVVELRYFRGLSVAETAEVPGISPETVKRNWKMARTPLLSGISRYICFRQTRVESVEKESLRRGVA